MPMSDQYKLIDCGHFKKLEQVGPFKFIRPSPQAVWAPTLTSSEWENIDAEYIRTSEGKGYWKEFNKAIPDEWIIENGGLKLKMQKTSFGHIGIFAEQQYNWAEFKELIAPKAQKKTEYKVLNLFAYTGGATIACAQAGAHCLHLDASKASNTWAKENAEINGLSAAPIRWITDDVKTFIAREIRRDNKYNAIILDPPTYGRGSKGQIWKVEDDMVPLLMDLKKLCAEDFHFMSLSSHSPGYTPIALKNLLFNIFSDSNGKYIHREMTVKYDYGELPAGSTALFIKE